jgi:hypothetical protein
MHGATRRGLVWLGGDLLSRYTRLFDSMSFRLNHQVSMKRQICSYDMVAVPPHSYTVTDAEGDMYLCNSRCLCICAVMLVTKHNLPESERDRSFVVANPVGKKRSCRAVLNS